MILHVTSLEMLQDYKVLLGFNNGEKRIFDYSSHLDFGVFKKLKNHVYFKTRATIENGTVAWDGTLDIAPEYLYENGVPV
jgi:hypothetical protein